MKTFKEEEETSVKLTTDTRLVESNQKFGWDGTKRSPVPQVQLYQMWLNILVFYQCSIQLQISFCSQSASREILKALACNFTQ